MRNPRGGRSRRDQAIPSRTLGVVIAGEVNVAQAIPARMDQRAKKHRQTVTGYAVVGPILDLPRLDREKGRDKAAHGHGSVRFNRACPESCCLALEEILPVGAERLLQPERHLGRERCLPVQQLRKGRPGHAQRLRDSRHRHVRRDDVAPDVCADTLGSCFIHNDSVFSDATGYNNGAVAERAIFQMRDYHRGRDVPRQLKDVPEAALAEDHGLALTSSTSYHGYIVRGRCYARRTVIAWPEGIPLETPSDVIVRLNPPFVQPAARTCG